MNHKKGPFLVYEECCKCARALAKNEGVKGTIWRGGTIFREGRTLTLATKRNSTSLIVTPSCVHQNLICQFFQRPHQLDPSISYGVIEISETAFVFKRTPLNTAVARKKSSSSRQKWHNREDHVVFVGKVVRRSSVRALSER